VCVCVCVCVCVFLSLLSGTRIVPYPRATMLPSVACSDVRYFPTLSHKRYDFRTNIIEHKMCSDVLLTVHLGITLVNAQLDAQFFYFIIRLLQSSTCFEQCRSHHQEVNLY
jgi:hypothetical protein